MRTVDIKQAMQRAQSIANELNSLSAVRTERLDAEAIELLLEVADAFLGIRSSVAE